VLGCKLLPVIVIVVPPAIGPAVGLIDVIVGAAASAIKVSPRNDSQLKINPPPANANTKNKPTRRGLAIRNSLLFLDLYHIYYQFPLLIWLSAHTFYLSKVLHL
jgi:hypothetical protein